MPGPDFVVEKIGLDRYITSCDLIITGEGRLDQTSLNGKLIQAITQKATEMNKLRIALWGSIDRNVVKKSDLLAVFSISEADQPLVIYLHNGPRLFSDLATAVFSCIWWGASRQ